MPSEVILQDAKVRKFINDKIKKIDGLEKALGGLISSVVSRDVDDHFRYEQGPNGRWRAWSTIYTEYMKRRKRGGNKILQDTGNLRQHSVPTPFRNIKGGALFYNNAKTKGGFPYAMAHQEGLGRLPKRKFLWLSKGAMQAITRQVLAHIGKK